MEEKQEKVEEITLKRHKLPKYLKEMDKYADKKALLKVLTVEDLQLYHAYQSELRDDTNNELTNTEYEIYAVMRLFLHKYYTWTQSKEIDETDIDLQRIVSKYETELSFAMRDYRKEGARSAFNIRDLKEAVINLKGEDGGEFNLEYKKDEPRNIMVDEDD